MSGDYIGFSRFVVLRSTGTTKNLKHIQHAQVNKITFLGVIQLSALDDDSMSRQINTPSKPIISKLNL